MTDSHPVLQVVSGDDWEIRATLFDENGNPYDLSGPPTIKWALLDAGDLRVLDTNDAVISITNALAGQCSILITAAKTATLAAGQYTDVIRIITGGVTSTLVYGPIFVTADPWKAPLVA